MQVAVKEVNWLGLCVRGRYQGAGKRDQFRTRFEDQARCGSLPFPLVHPWHVRVPCLFSSPAARWFCIALWSSKVGTQWSTQAEGPLLAVQLVA